MPITRLPATTTAVAAAGTSLCRPPFLRDWRFNPRPLLVSSDDVLMEAAAAAPKWTLNDTNIGPGDFQLWSELVTILVGPDFVPFDMHLHVAIIVPFIAICLASDMKESQTKKIWLPEDSPECFAEIVEWCCTGRSPLRLKKLTSATPMTASFNSTSSRQARPYGINDMIRKDEANRNLANTSTFKASDYVLSPAWEAAQHRNEERVAHAIKTYTLARKLLMEDLPNEIIDEIVLSSSKTWHYSEYVYRCVFAGEDIDPWMKRYLVQEIARDIRAVGWEAWKKGYEEGFNKWVHGSIEAVEMLMGAVAGDGVHFEVKRSLDVDASATGMESSRAMISEDELCKWHVHDATAKCGTPLTMAEVGRRSGGLKRKTSFTLDGPQTDFGQGDRPSQRGFGSHTMSLPPSSRLQEQEVTRESSFSSPAVTRPLSVVPPMKWKVATKDRVCRD